MRQFPNRSPSQRLTSVDEILEQNEHDYPPDLSRAGGQQSGRLNLAGLLVRARTCSHGYQRSAHGRVLPRDQTSEALWAIKDPGGFPAAIDGEGRRSIPFWSTASRAQHVITTVAAYSGGARNDPG